MMLATIILGIVIALLAIGLWAWWEDRAKVVIRRNLDRAFAIRGVRISTCIGAVLGLWLALYWWLGWCLGTNVSFQSSDGGWEGGEELFKGLEYDGVLMSFEAYRLTCGAEDAVLQRTTPVPPPYRLEFWFNNYLAPKWRVPYAARRPQQVRPLSADRCPARSPR